MAERRIDPPRSEFGKLLMPLTEGERRVIDLFDRMLPPAWEIYVQPHLNGLRPDIVLLHPDVGVAVFEVKDWDLAAMQYSAEKDSRSGELRLMGRDANGHRFCREDDNPVTKIRLYKSELFDLYCPRLNDRAGFAAITAGLIFTTATRPQVESVFGPFRAEDEGVTKYPQYYPMAATEDVARGALDVIFPEWKRTSSQFMTADVAEDLRAWLREPAFSREQRLPLEMDARQRDLATTRTESGYRRIKGPAGSGKSVVLAARAAELADQGKRVLVVTFNITLLNYLRDLAVRHATSRQVIRRQVDFLNFHMWCKRVCIGSGNRKAYSEVWARSSDGDELQPDPVLQVELARLVQRLYQQSHDSLPRYDAVLVDEGQDYYPEWWQTLRKAAKPDGEMILVADKTQNIYSTAAAWTEDAMANAGFRGPWAELRISYRLPPAVIPLLEGFAEQYLGEEEADIPEVEQRENQMEFADLFPVELRWVQVGAPESSVASCVEEIRRQMKRLRTDTAIPDITFLSGKEVGRAVVDEFSRLGVHVLHTFDADKSISRRQKRAFFQGSARVKATTLHSFKGWEARHLVLFVGSVDRAEDRALIYTALTRLRRHENGSALTVVCACPELFSYGKSWPEFAQV